MRKLIFIFLTFTATSVNKLALAQQQKDLFGAFKLSFMKNFKYPTIIRDSCMATATVIKISQTKSTLSIILSDSAPELFKQEFDKIIGKLNTDYIKHVLNSKKEDYNILIPVYYTFSMDYSVPAGSFARRPCFRKHGYLIY